MLKVYSFQNLKKMNKAAFILSVVSVVCLWGCHDRFDEQRLLPPVLLTRVSFIKVLPIRMVYRAD